MESESPTLKHQRDRRRRVGRIKTVALIALCTILAGCIFVNVVLMIKVNSLQNQIDMLAEVMDTRFSASWNMPSSLPEDENTVVTVTPAVDNKNTISDDAYIDNELELVEDGVVNPALNKAQEGDHHQVYLTFDDGPSDNTDAILDILASYNVKATFFVVGKNDEESLERYKRIVEEGHTLAMHSYAHDYGKIYESEQSFIDDYKKLSKLLYDTTGVTCNLYRFPGGSSNKVSDTDISVYVEFLNTENVRYFDWNVSSGDAAAGNYSSDDIIENVMSNVVKYKESVVLMHDTAAKDKTVEALPDILEALQAMNAEVLPITDETLAVHHGKISQ